MMATNVIGVSWHRITDICCQTRVPLSPRPRRVANKDKSRPVSEIKGPLKNSWQHLTPPASLSHVDKNYASRISHYCEYANFRPRDWFIERLIDVRAPFFTSACTAMKYSRRGGRVFLGNGGLAYFWGDSANLISSGIQERGQWNRNTKPGSLPPRLRWSSLRKTPFSHIFATCQSSRHLGQTRSEFCPRNGKCFLCFYLAQARQKK